MSDERGNSMQLEAVKTEQDPLKKFIMYISYLKDLPQADPTIKDVKIDQLKSKDATAFFDFIKFLKTLTPDNCSNEYIKKQIDDIMSSYGMDGSLSNKENLFKSWMSNKISPFFGLRFRELQWEAESEQDYGIKDFLEITLQSVNPDQIF